MPIHPIDGKPLIKVETNVGGEWVDLEDSNYRKNQYKRNQQTEGRLRYVVEPLPGTVPEPTPEPTPEPVEPTAAPVDKELTKALKKDLSKRGLPEVKTPKTRNKKTLD